MTVKLTHYRAAQSAPECLCLGSNATVLVRLDVFVEPCAARQVPTVNHQIRAQEAFDGRLERAPAEHPFELGPGPLGVFDVAVDCRPGRLPRAEWIVLE